MDITKRKEINDRFEYDYRMVAAAGYEVFGVFLYGSQNYQVDIETSDIDTRVVVFPTFEELYMGKMASGSGKCDSGTYAITDIRVWLNSLCKGHINFLETLYTDYYMCTSAYLDDYLVLRDNREEIVRCDMRSALNAYKGIIHNSMKRLVNRATDCGYEPKAYADTWRLVASLGKYLLGETYDKCLVPSVAETLRDVKRGKYVSIWPAEQVLTSAENLEKMAVRTIDEYIASEKPQKNEYIIGMVQNFGRRLLKEYLEGFCYSLGY